MWTGRTTLSYFGVIVILGVSGLLFLAWRARTVDCVRNLVRVEVKVVGLKQSGAELVIRTTPADKYHPEPARRPVGNGVSTQEVLFNPFSREKLNCSRALETVEVTLEGNGETFAKRTLVYPQDFVVDAKGEYSAREPIIFQP